MGWGAENKENNFFGLEIETNTKWFLSTRGPLLSVVDHVQWHMFIWYESTISDVF